MNIEEIEKAAVHLEGLIQKAIDNYLKLTGVAKVDVDVQHYESLGTLDITHVTRVTTTLYIGQRI